MKFTPPLTEGTLIKRYKRFLADVVLDDGTELTAHVPNTGSMASTSDPGSRVALSYQSNPKRKLKWTLELIQGEGHAWVGVNTFLTNAIVECREQSLERWWDDNNGGGTLILYRPI